MREPRVSVGKLAICNEPGRAMFFETTLEGSGSPLPLGNHRSIFGSQQAESFEVLVSTLDLEYKSTKIHVLHIYVQGAERLVLAGASDVLAQTRAILIEVSMREELYKRGATWSEFSSELEDLGFFPVLVGMDTNWTGNALFVRRTEFV